MPTVNFYTTPQSVSPNDFFKSGVELEGSALNVADTALAAINVPIPAGVNVGFGIAINVMGLSASGLPTVLQRFSHAVVRDGAGLLKADGGFGSGNDMNQMSRIGSGLNQPILAGGAVNANDVQYNFQNTSGAPLDIHYQVIVSPAKTLTPFVPPPVP